MEKELSVFKIGQTNDAYAKFFTGQIFSACTSNSAGTGPAGGLPGRWSRPAA